MQSELLTHNRPKTAALFQEMCEIIPGGVNSPIRNCRAVEQIPLIVHRGDKDKIYDIDGESYIDFCGSWGALIYGHSHPRVIQAIQRQANFGTTFGITCEVEAALAKKVVELIPSIEKVRFVSSGTEATMTAARLARGYTKRDVIVKFAGNYHGHADFFLVKAGSGVMGLIPSSTSSGIPKVMLENSICLKYNDIDECKQLLNSPDYKDRIAAVIIEPIAANMGVIPATMAFLHMLRQETKKIGALLIFDEVITGFRVGLSGVQGLTGIVPDLTCLGKIVGGGLPAAAFGGRKEIMDCLSPVGQVYQAGTLSGNPLAMCSGYETLCMLQEEKGVYKELERKADVITQPVKEAIKKHKINACIQQVGSMFTLFFGRSSVSNQEEALQVDNKIFAKFFKYMLDKGIYIPPLQVEAWFVSRVHEEDHLINARDSILSFIMDLK